MKIITLALALFLITFTSCVENSYHEKICEKYDNYSYFSQDFETRTPENGFKTNYAYRTFKYKYLTILTDTSEVIEFLHDFEKNITERTGAIYKITIIGNTKWSLFINYIANKPFVMISNSELNWNYFYEL